MSDLVKNFYNANASFELNRLDLPLCKIEFAGTLRLIEKYFPKQGKICDIGGGPGRYSIELAMRGYDVTLTDLSEEEIRLARTAFKENNISAEQMIVSDARDLRALASDIYDAGLLLGPMYHLVNAESRADALREFHRVLKSGGVGIIAYLNSWGLMRTGINDFPSRYENIDFLRSMLGEKIFLGNELKNFTESYWATPELALAEVERSGFEIVSYAGAESFASGMALQLEKLERNNPKVYANILQAASETGEMEQFRDNTDHLHIIAKKV